MTTNYLQIMIDSLKKKTDILIKIVSLNEKQNEILTKEELNQDAFENNMHEKGECIDELEKLDEGFQSVFDRIKEELSSNKQLYFNEIETMKKLIKEARIWKQELQLFL